MTWVALLLADRSPCLRWLVLSHLLERKPDDPELVELARLRGQDALVTELSGLQQPEGYWRHSSGGDSLQSRLRSTALALIRLAYLGFGPNDAAVQRGLDYLLCQQCEDGAWPLDYSGKGTGSQDGYSMVPLQTALPLQALAACGLATHAQAELAYDWLEAQRLPDGAWPTGIVAGSYGGVGGYRRLAHSRWGCASATLGATICLAHHPQRRNSPQAHRALDLLLGRETRERHHLGFELARILGAEPARGFITFHARHDCALLLDLCARIGVASDDPRVADLMAFVRSLQGPHGLWQHATHPHLSRWLTLDLLRSLSRLEHDTAKTSSWISLEPRTPFRAYPKSPRRY
jgi:hypothetical protein